jgi:DNA-binding beta-propeller fold protein YncE
VLTSLGFAHTGQIPFGVTVESTGRFAYVVNFFDRTVSQYIVRANGTLATNGTPLSLSFDLTSEPELIATELVGSARLPSTCAYVTDDGLGVVHELQIDASTGLLSDLGNVDAMGKPFGIAAHPTGRFIYTANPKSNSISVFTQLAELEGTCTITLTSQVTASAAEVTDLSGPISIAVEPSGKFAYTANSSDGTVGEYSIDSGTGALTAIGEVNTETPPNPGSVPISAVTTH